MTGKLPRYQAKDRDNQDTASQQGDRRDKTVVVMNVLISVIEDKAESSSDKVTPYSQIVTMRRGLTTKVTRMVGLADLVRVVVRMINI